MAALSTLATLATIGSAVGGIIMGKKQLDAQEKAQAENAAAAARTADLADQANNKANQKKPNMAAIELANKDLGLKGVSSTLLTGAQGVDPSSLKLGRTTLLGA